MRLLLAFAVSLLSSPVAAQEWFVHEFGELRAYHGDWLAICRDGGAGDCRVVQPGLEPGDDSFFGSSRLAVNRLDAGGYTFEVNAGEITYQTVTAAVFHFGSRSIDVPEVDVVTRDQYGTLTVNTIYVMNPEITGELVTAMRASNRLVVQNGQFLGADRGMGAGFSLRGVSAALDAVERQILERQE